jgi:pimeloyl-ACP methyl ester carboxylesterase
MIKKIGRVFGIFMILTMVAYGLVRFVLPLESYHLAHRVQLWMGGARQFQSVGMTGYVRNHCDPADPEARGCTCIALIHGLGDDPETWSKVLLAPASAWKKPVRIYALQMQRERMFAPSAETPKEAYEVRNQAHQLAQALKPLCPSFVVVGNSLGGWIASWLALEQEVPVTRLVLSDAMELRSAYQIGLDLFGHPSVDMLKEFQKRAYFHPREIPDSVWRKVYERFQEAHLDEVLKAQKEEDFIDTKLGSLRVPTLVLWGAADRLIPLSEGRALEHSIPGALWRELPNCGHIPQKECPGPYIQAINSMLVFGTM